MASRIECRAWYSDHGQIDSDIGQEIADSVVTKDGREEAEQLFAGKNRPKLEARAREYIRDSGIENSIISRYQQDSSGINPEQKYRTGAAEVNAKAGSINLEHERNKQKIDADAGTKKPGVNEQEFNKVKNNVEAQHNKIGSTLKKAGNKQDKQYKNMHDKVSKNIQEGEEKLENSVYGFGSVKPNFASSNKKKKQD